MSLFPTARPCECGSEEYSEEVFDGHGIYLCRACSKCMKEKLSGFRYDIMGFYDCDEDIEDEWSDDFNGNDIS